MVVEIPVDKQQLHRRCQPDVLNKSQFINSIDNQFSIYQRFATKGVEVADLRKLTTTTASDSAAIRTDQRN